MSRITFKSQIKGLAVLSIILFGSNVNSQNVGVGTATPLEKLHVIGNVRASTLSGIGNRIVLADPNGTLLTASGLGSPAWMVTGNSGLSGGSNTTAGANFIGNTDAQNICFRTNNIERGRFSALGEFFVGTFNTVVPGDLMNAVGNPTFPWAVNGYVPAGSNGGGVYGQIQSGNGTVFGAVQGEYSGTNASGAGVRGIAINPFSIGVQGQEPSLLGWAGYFNGDVFSTTGYYIASDERLKKDVNPLSNALDQIKRISIYSYYYDQAKYPNLGLSNRLQYGVLANELAAILPSAVATKKLVNGSPSRTSGTAEVSALDIQVVNYEMLIPLLVAAMKEQQELIEQLQQRITTLETQSK